MSEGFQCTDGDTDLSFITTSIRRALDILNNYVNESTGKNEHIEFEQIASKWTLNLEKKSQAREVGLKLSELYPFFVANMHAFPIKILSIIIDIFSFFDDYVILTMLGANGGFDAIMENMSRFDDRKLGMKVVCYLIALFLSKSEEIREMINDCNLKDLALLWKKYLYDFEVSSCILSVFVNVSYESNEMKKKMILELDVWNEASHMIDFLVSGSSHLFKNASNYASLLLILCQNLSGNMIGAICGENVNEDIYLLTEDGELSDSNFLQMLNDWELKVGKDNTQFLKDNLFLFHKFLNVITKNDSIIGNLIWNILKCIFGLLCGSHYLKVYYVKSLGFTAHLRVLIDTFGNDFQVMHSVMLLLKGVARVDCLRNTVYCEFGSDLIQMLNNRDMHIKILCLVIEVLYFLIFNSFIRRKISNLLIDPLLTVYGSKMNDGRVCLVTTKLMIKLCDDLQVRKDFIEKGVINILLDSLHNNTHDQLILNYMGVLSRIFFQGRDYEDYERQIEFLSPNDAISVDAVIEKNVASNEENEKNVSTFVNKNFEYQLLCLKEQMKRQHDSLLEKLLKIEEFNNQLEKKIQLIVNAIDVLGTLPTSQPSTSHEEIKNDQQELHSLISNFNSNLLNLLYKMKILQLDGKNTTNSMKDHVNNPNNTVDRIKRLVYISSPILVGCFAVLFSISNWNLGSN